MSVAGDPSRTCDALCLQAAWWWQQGTAHNPHRRFAEYSDGCSAGCTMAAVAADAAAEPILQTHNRAKLVSMPLHKK